MKQFSYYLEHTTGVASGSITATSEKAAKKKLTDQYSAQHTDADDNKIKVVVKKIELKDLGDVQ